jgi:hypothetical protein
MSKNPLNLGFRFLLELAALFALGYWGWTTHFSATRFLWGIGLPILAMIIWGTFAVPNDPSRSGKAPIPTPGIVRLLLELTFFALGTWAFLAAGQPTWGWLLGGLTILHYVLSYDRIEWLMQKK